MIRMLAHPEFVFSQLQVWLHSPSRQARLHQMHLKPCLVNAFILYRRLLPWDLIDLL